MRKQAYYVYMRRLAALALIVAGVALPACAQRGGARGGSFSGGHSAPAFHGGMSAPTSRGFASSSRSTLARPMSIARAPQRIGLGVGLSRSSARQPYTGDRRRRMPYISPYGTRVLYGPGWVSPYFLPYSDIFDYDDSPAAQSYGPEIDNSQPPDASIQPWPGPYQPAYQLPPQPSALPQENATTLIFKDGRSPEEIHNYILTRTTLYVLDQRRRDIPIDQLDLEATAKANHEAGVDFQLPAAAN